MALTIPEFENNVMAEPTFTSALKVERPETFNDDIVPKVDTPVTFKCVVLVIPVIESPYPTVDNFKELLWYKSTDLPSLISICLSPLALPNIVLSVSKIKGTPLWPMIVLIWLWKIFKSSLSPSPILNLTLVPNCRLFEEASKNILLPFVVTKVTSSLKDVTPTLNLSVPVPTVPSTSLLTNSTQFPAWA